MAVFNVFFRLFCLSQGLFQIFLYWNYWKELFYNNNYLKNRLLSSVSYILQHNAFSTQHIFKSYFKSFKPFLKPFAQHMHIDSNINYLSAKLAIKINKVTNKNTLNDSYYYCKYWNNRIILVVRYWQLFLSFIIGFIIQPLC